MITCRKITRGNHNIYEKAENPTNQKNMSIIQPEEWKEKNEINRLSENWGTPCQYPHTHNGFSERGEKIKGPHRIVKANKWW